MLSRIRSDRVSQLVQSDIRAMTIICNEVGGVNMGQGICDVPTPEVVKQAAIAAVEGNESIYTRYDGIDPLRGALAKRLKSFNGIDVDPDGEIVVTVGSSGAFACTLMALCNPGDEIILFEPYYGYHLNTARVAGLTPKFYALAPPDFAIDFDRLESLVTARTRAIVVNTPVNPSGKVFRRDELEAIGDICKRHDLLCITDEVYEYLVFGDAEHVSMASLPGMKERTVTLSSYSKTFSITGWRIGYAAAQRELAAAIGLMNDLYYICSPAPLQHAVAHGIEVLGDDYYADMKAGYFKKREQFCGVLQQIGLAPIVPDGAYYVLADISSLGEDTAKAAALRILHEAKVASVPGSAFYQGAVGETLTRFCFAKRQTHIDAACEQLLTWHRTR